MIDEILKNDRRLRIAWKSFEKDAQLYEIIKNYIDELLGSTGLSEREVRGEYYSFIDNYIDSSKIFSETKQYPYEYREIRDYNRTYYDIALLLSIIVAKHRYQIIRHIYKSSFGDGQNILIVGLGSGIEMDLILKSTEGIKLNIDAYDMTIGPYVKDRFKNSVNLFETKFEGTNNKYDAIIAIELLEHLPDPINFMKNCGDSLESGGKCLVTTATNMPQEDHLFNFDDLEGFENKCADMGLEVEFKEDIQHLNTYSGLESKNTWYVFKRR